MDSAPELTQLGKHLEILRIERGVSKQRLARHAGTSRQQLWRVMTGKSELTSALCDRLAMALSVESSSLRNQRIAGATRSLGISAHTLTMTSVPAPPPAVSTYLADVRHLEATIMTLPSGDGGRRLKRALLNAVEDLAIDAAQTLPIDFAEIRRRVLAGEL
ncbi:MAG: helix-turn-helix domain-containing protein [Gemmatimonadaceae bacterium]|nr:helix-turn-helix domain-containing protein [Gemmatimonadaceae bacterium]